MSSPKSFAFEVDPSGKSFENNESSKTEPLRTLALICDHFKNRPLRRSISYLLDKNKSISPKYFLHIPMRFSLYTKDAHVKLYQLLWIHLERLLSLSTMDLYQMLYKCHELLK